MVTIIVIVFMVFDEEESRTLKIIVNITVLRMTTSTTLTCDVSANRAILPRNLSAGNLALSTLHLFMSSQISYKSPLKIQSFHFSTPITSIELNCESTLVYL